MSAEWYAEIDRKLRHVRVILLDPFHGYAALTVKERQAATLASRGVPGRTIAKMLGTGWRNAYRILESAAAKVAEQDRREMFKWTDLPAVVHEMLTEAVK